MLKPNTKVSKALTIKNGAKGTSDFMPSLSKLLPCDIFEKIMRTTLTIVPSQKDNMILKTPADIPSIHPSPRTNLPSPSPIRRPFEKYQRNANGNARTGPAKKFARVGSVKIEPNKDEFIKIEKKEIKTKKKTNLSGIIL